MRHVELVPPCGFINSNDRAHFQARAKLTRGWRQAAAAAAGGLTPCERAHIRVAVRFPTNHRRDVGNLYPTAKAIVDGLVDAGVLPDDDDAHVIGPDMRRLRPNGPPLVQVTIQPIDDMEGQE